MKKSIKILIGSACLSVAILNLTLNQENKTDASLAFSDIEYIAYGQEGIENGTTGGTPYCNTQVYGKDNTIGQFSCDTKGETYDATWNGPKVNPYEHDVKKTTKAPNYGPYDTDYDKVFTEEQRQYGGYAPLSNTIEKVGTNYNTYISNGKTCYTYWYDYVKRCVGTKNGNNYCTPKVVKHVPAEVNPYNLSFFNN